MVELTIISSLCVSLLVGVIVYLLISQKAERAELHNRIMAMSDPDKFIQYKAIEKPEQGNVTYVDEKYESEHGTES